MASSAVENGHSMDPSLFWTVAPNDTDWMAWGGIATLAFAVYFLLYLYAKFDQWAEQKAHGTPLAKTIPTLLGIALLYEVFPLDHFSILLPLSAILIAVMVDWMRENAKHDHFPAPIGGPPNPVGQAAQGGTPVKVQKPTMPVEAPTAKEPEPASAAGVSSKISNADTAETKSGEVKNV